jgi:hypothetical protein
MEKICKIHGKPNLFGKNSTISKGCVDCIIESNRVHKRGKVSIEVEEDTHKKGKFVKSLKNGFNSNIAKVSKKQEVKNRKIEKNKKTLGEKCLCKGCRSKAVDPAHLLPRSTFPEYADKDWILVPMCRTCHDQYDNSEAFRQKQEHLYNIIASHDIQAAHRYFFGKELKTVNL